MTQDVSSSDGDKLGRLCFMLSQLRDDLGDLVSGLEQGTMSYEVVAAGAKAQLQWVLNSLDQIEQASGVSR